MIDRGALLVWPEEEWRERNRRRSLRSAKGLIMFGTMMFLTLSAVITYMVIRDHPVRWFDVLLIVIPTFATYVLAKILSNHFRMRADRKLPPEGLYENGVQLSHRVFLPYEEVSRVERIGRTVTLRRGASRNPLPGVKIAAGWLMDMDVLGEEGLEELEARVAGRPTGEEPPRLMLYGG